MIQSIINGFGILLKKPFLILLSIIFLIANSVMLFLLIDYWFELMWFFIFPSFEFSFELFPFYLIARYPIELFVVFLMSLISLILFNWLFNSIAISLIKEKNPLSAGIESFLNWQKLSGIALFYFITGMLFFAGFFLFLIIFSQFDLIIFLLILLFFLFIFVLIGLIVSYKLLFIPVILVFESNAKKAIQKSWAFTSKHFFNGIILFMVLFIIYSLINTIALEVSDLIEEETISGIVFLLISAVGLTYMLVSLTEFFKRKNKTIY